MEEPTYSHEIHRRERNADHDRKHLTGLLDAYKNPDPHLGGTPEALPVLARLMQPHVRQYVTKYAALAASDAPASLRMTARSLQKLASDLLELLESLAEEVADPCGA